MRGLFWRKRRSPPPVATKIGDDGVDPTQLQALPPQRALILLLVTLNNRIRDANAQQIIDAVERFRRERPLYPDSLQQLVPLYLDQVPRANYTLMGQGFRYAGDAEDPRLAYLTAMPYRGRFYRFATRQWEEFD